MEKVTHLNSTVWPKSACWRTPPREVPALIIAELSEHEKFCHICDLVQDKVKFNQKNLVFVIYLETKDTVCGPPVRLRLETTDLTLKPLVRSDDLFCAETGLAIIKLPSEIFAQVTTHLPSGRVEQCEG